jgi:hypothetical protein
MGKMLERMKLFHLLSKGKASPEQQIEAYKEMLKSKEEEEKRRTLPIKRNKTTQRCICLYTIIRHEERTEENFTKTECYKFIAAEFDIKEETVIREYRKWSKGKSTEELDKEVTQHYMKALSILNK